MLTTWLYFQGQVIPREKLFLFSELARNDEIISLFVRVVEAIINVHLYLISSFDSNFFELYKCVFGDFILTHSFYLKTIRNEYRILKQENIKNSSTNLALKS